MTKLTTLLVPSAAIVLALGVVFGAAICNLPRPAGVRPAAIQPPAPPTSLGEVRSEAESVAQIDGMSLDAENAMVLRTDFYFHHGDYPRIIALDRIVTEIDPTDIETYSTGGWLMESDGDMNDAEAYYSLGVQRNPQNADAAYYLAMFYYNTLHLYPKAEAAMTKAVLYPDVDALDWKLLAHTYERENRYDKAVATWQYILKKYPTTPAAAVNLQHDQAVLAASSTTNSPVPQPQPFSANPSPQSTPPPSALPSQVSPETAQSAAPAVK